MDNIKTEAEFRELLSEQVLKIKDIQAKELIRIFADVSDEIIGHIYESAISYNEEMKSCVYFIKNEYTGLIKIGCTDNLVRRMKELKSLFSLLAMNGNKLKIVGLAVTFPRYGNKLEKQFHYLFNEYRVCGEWFDIKNKVIEEFLLEYANNAMIINDVPVNFDDNESRFFKPISKSYELSLEDIGIEQNLFCINQFLNSVLSKQNQLMKIVESINKNQTGFCYEYYHKTQSLCRTGTSFDGKSITFEEIKKNKFSPEYWGNIINQTQVVKS